MRIKHVAPNLIKRYLDEKTRRRAVFLRGKSGIGKTDSVFQASDILSQYVDDWQGVTTMLLSQMDPTDVRGLPMVVDGRTTYARPLEFPSTGSGILFLDEITSAPSAVQAVAYQITLKPEDFGIPKGWMVVAAGNNKSDRGVTYNIAAPLLNRMCDLEVETTLDDFTMHAIDSGIRPEILSFLRDRPDFLHKFEGGSDIQPFPSPRSWFAVSDLLSLDIPQADRLEMIKGDIGAEAGLAFETHLRIWDTMPRIDDILEGKDVPVPDKLDVAYCVAMGLAVRVDEHTFENAWKFISKLGGDVQSLIMKLAFQRDRNIQRSPAFAKWAVANQAAFRNS